MAEAFDGPSRAISTNHTNTHVRVKASMMLCLILAAND